MAKRALKILYISVLDGKTTEFKPIGKLVESLRPEIPETVSQVIIEHKFMTFVPPEETPADQPIYLIFGPVYRAVYRGEGYRHALMVKRAETLIPELVAYSKSGGTLKVIAGGAWPTAEFGGASGDFGVFNPVLLQYCSEIAATLELELYFKFNEYAKAKP